MATALLHWPTMMANGLLSLAGLINLLVDDNNNRSRVESTRERLLLDEVFEIVE